MAILNIIQHPDERLRITAKEVTKFDQELAQTIIDMQETMSAAEGIGLAGTQVNIHQQIITIDFTEQEKEQKYVIINPKIISLDNDTCTTEEGCLSIPGVHEKVKRPKTISIQYQDSAGNEQKLTAEGLLATCIQHEIDHLNGILFTDHLSTFKRNKIEKKLSKLKKQSG